jgi:hypothetical protein
LRLHALVRCASLQIRADAFISGASSLEPPGGFA